MVRTIYAKDPENYIPELAKALKDISSFKVPEWAKFVKTGVSRMRPPVDDNFWFIRAASMLRQLYIQGVVGVEKLRTRYGSKKNRGGRPFKFQKASGKIIRTILQQAEKAGLVEKVDRLQHGRRLTVKGREFLDSINVEAKKGLDLSSMTIQLSQEHIDRKNKEDKETQEINNQIEEENDGW